MQPYDNTIPVSSMELEIIRRLREVERRKYGELIVKFYDGEVTDLRTVQTTPPQRLKELQPKKKSA